MFVRWRTIINAEAINVVVKTGIELLSPNARTRMGIAAAALIELRDT